MSENPTTPPSKQGAGSFGVGVGAGIAIGVAIGVALHDIAVGVAIGVALGVALGAGLSQREKDGGGSSPKPAGRG